MNVRTLTRLEEAVPDNGIRSVNFFNGRLLTGADLGREQQARQEADRLGAVAAGHGVVWGLEVQAAAQKATGTAGNGKNAAATGDEGPQLDVQPGLAIARDGTPLHLAQPLRVVVGRAPSPRRALSRSFKACAATPRGDVAADPGTYLLTLAPAARNEGRALTHALDDAAVPCNTDVQRNTVRLRLLPLGAQLADEKQAVQQRQPTNEDPTHTSRYRNRVAHRCLGTDAVLRFIADPLSGIAGSQGDYGLLAALRQSGTLRDDEVPLAVLNLGIGLDWVDTWAVRRRVTRHGSGGRWGALVDDRRSAEGEAAFLQFQQQMGEIAQANKTPVTQTGATPTIMVARQHFDFLPAAGVIELPEPRGAAQAATTRFFDGLTTRGPAYIEGAHLAELLRASFDYPPIDLASGELIWLYEVRQNRERLDYRVSPSPTPCLVFVSGHVPYRADARVGLSRWQYANLPLDR